MCFVINFNISHGSLFSFITHLFSKVMYVGVTFTGNGPYRSEVPAVSSRSLDSNNLFQVINVLEANVIKITSKTNTFFND